MVKLGPDLVAARHRWPERGIRPGHGGFGAAHGKFSGTKFPMPPQLDLLPTSRHRLKSDELTGM